MQRMKNTYLDKSFVIASLCGGGVSCIIDIVLSIVMALCLNSEYLALSTMVYLSPIAQFFSILMGMLLAVNIKREGAVLTCVITGVFCLVMRLSAAMLFFDGISAAIVIGMIAATGVSILFLYLLRTRRKMIGSRRNKRRYR